MSIKKIFEGSQRVIFDIFALVSLVLILWFSPYEEAKTFLTNLFVTKMFVVSSGILHAHISRKLLFPYIHFSKEEDWSNNLIIIVWYVTIIMAWARGG